MPSRVCRVPPEGRGWGAAKSPCGGGSAGGPAVAWCSGSAVIVTGGTNTAASTAKAKGKLLGRPKGALGTSRLDGKEQDIRALLGKDVSKASIAKILDVSRSALYHFIQTRKIAPG